MKLEKRTFGTPCIYLFIYLFIYYFLRQNRSGAHVMGKMQSSNERWKKQGAKTKVSCQVLPLVTPS